MSVAVVQYVSFSKSDKSNLCQPLFTSFHWQDEAKKSKYPNDTDFSFPVNSEKMRALMQYNPKLYNTSKLSQAYYRFFEVALGYWLTHGNTSYNNDDFVTYSLLLGGQIDPTSKKKTPSFQGELFGILLPARELSWLLSNQCLSNYQWRIWIW